MNKATSVENIQLQTCIIGLAEYTNQLDSTINQENLAILSNTATKA